MDAYTGVSADTIEGRMVAEMTDVIHEIEQLYAEALADASENYQANLTPGEEGVVVNQNGDPVAYNTEDGSVRLSMRTYEEDAVVEGKRDKSLSSIVDEIQKTLPKTEAENAETQVEQADRDLESDIRYSIREKFSGDIDQWSREGRPDGASFTLGTTGDVIQGMGAVESDIYMLGDKIKVILDKHPEITLDEIKKIPQILENPILILESQNVGRQKANTRMVLFGSVKAKNGLPVTTILDLRPVENHLVIEDMQKVSSVYTKDSNPVEFVQNSNVLYADKKRATSLLRSIGFQTPIELNKSGFIGNISYIGRKVKMDGIPFTDVVDQTLYQERSDDSISNRSLLANALETAAQNDSEQKRLAEYKKKIDLIQAEEQNLRDLNAKIEQLSADKRNQKTDEMKELREEAMKTGNRISTYDRQLLRLEATKPLQELLQREKKAAY